MTYSKVRNQLMDGVIKVVARDGFDKLTTRSIASECGLHDTYIYRYFLDKEDLMRRAFIREDEKMIRLMLDNISKMDINELPFEEKLRGLWIPVWDYLISHPDSCRFYVRYYYSAHFEGEVVEAFRDNNKQLKQLFKSFCPDDKDVEVLFHHNVDTVLHLAMRFTIGELTDKGNLREDVLKLICSINKAYIS